MTMAPERLHVAQPEKDHEEPQGFPPDFSFILRPDYGNNDPKAKCVSRVYDLGNGQVLLGTGGNHSYKTSAPVVDEVRNAWGGFMELTGGENSIAVVEGRVRNVDFTMNDEEVVSLHGEVGLSEAFARRAGVEVRSCEPHSEMWVGLAKKYGNKARAAYWAYRVIPQWCGMDDKVRPPLDEYIYQALERQYEQIANDEIEGDNDNAQWGFSQVSDLWQDYSMHYTLGLDASYMVPLGQLRPSEELAQTMINHTTHGPILRTIAPSERTLMHNLVIQANFIRDTCLIEEIINLAHQGKNVFYNYGEIHIRALDVPMRQLQYSLHGDEKRATK
jgi:hypothetical protein